MKLGDQTAMKNLGRLLAVGVAVLLVVAARRSNDIHVERSTLIAATPESIFARIDNFHRWSEWSPIEKKDLAMKRFYGRIEAGKGATFGWRSSGIGGAGTMEIVESSPPDKIRIKLDFLDPLDLRNVTEFRLTPEANATRVTWELTGTMSYPAKVFALFINLETMIGRSFESGLAVLKRSAETEAGAASAAPAPAPAASPPKP